jgi:hypothetical protein
MNWKVIGYGAAILFCIAIAVGFGIKLTQKAEGYKASGNQYNMKAEPRFGCATLKVYFYGKEQKENATTPDSVNSGELK